MLVLHAERTAIKRTLAGQEQSERSESRPVWSDCDRFGTLPKADRTMLTMSAKMI